MAKNDDDEEEAARERRRRARQERLRSRESEDPSSQSDKLCVLSPLSVTENVSVSGSYGDGGDDEEQALLDRMAKREERRQRRMKEALERQKQLDPAASEASEGVALEKNNMEEERPSSWRKGRYRDSMDEDEKTFSSRQEKEQDWPTGDTKAATEEEEEEEEQKTTEVEVIPRRSIFREQDCNVDNSTLNRNMLLSNDTEEDFEVSEILHAMDNEDENARLEAERKLEELKRRRDDAESEEFERMRQKQQEAEAELEELKRKREERRKILEEEERQRKQEEEERKAREEEEKRKMKEEIERRRAEAAEKRQKVDDTMDGEGKPFKCVSPRGSSLKAAHSPVVSKIDNRLEQYTSARENKESRSPRAGAVDLPVVTDSIRNIKSMWEKGSVFNAPGNGGSAFKEAAVIKTGVAGRINDWLNKTPDGGRTPGGKPTDLKPVDVTNKRSLWENKGGASTKVKLLISALAPMLIDITPAKKADFFLSLHW
uniref:Caldesmon 1b n=1 Tax=Oryzias latipes TaxID=8090 RepID=H2M4H8_ORYLA